MQTVTWEQETDPQKLKLHFNSLGQSYYLTQPEVINQLVSSYQKDMRLHKDQQVFDIDFTHLHSVAQKPGIARKRDDNQVRQSQEVCSIEQNGQWLGPDGWQSERQLINLRPAHEKVAPATPPPVVTKQLCTNCGTMNMVGALVCRQCGSSSHFQPVYE